MNRKSVCIFTALLSVFIQVTARETYRAAVVEYSPIVTSDKQSNLDKNAKTYIEFINQAKQKGAEIIVFPEGGLMSDIPSRIPNPADKIAPCDNLIFQTTQAVKDLSKAAKTQNIYVVVNLVEKRDCNQDMENCPSVGYYTFNTNVVFDRYGTVIARYAKYNLYEEKFDITPAPEMIFFDTDFGVRFGTFTCFDILFGIPTLALVNQYGITDFVFTTYWFSEFPYLTAFQVQRGWAETNNVNLLASGVNNPKTGSGGSGIFNGKFGEIVAIMPEVKTSKLIIADVPKRQNSNGISQEYTFSFSGTLNSTDNALSMPKTKYSSDEEKMYLKADLSVYSSQSEIIEAGKTFEKTLCSGKGFCCDFYVNMDYTGKDSTDIHYRAVVYNGVRLFGLSFRGGVQTCGVLACNGPHIQNCTSRITKNLDSFKFNDIKIKGRFKGKNSLQIPTTLVGGKKLEPLQVYKYEFAKNKTSKNTDVSLELIWPSNSIQTFSIWGRDYSRDNEELASGSSIVRCGQILVGIFAMLTLYFR